jgi:hypothetical protein
MKVKKNLKHQKNHVVGSCGGFWRIFRFLFYFWLFNEVISENLFTKWQKFTAKKFIAPPRSQIKYFSSYMWIRKKTPKVNQCCASMQFTILR